jgi:hypothetical protein
MTPSIPEPFALIHGLYTAKIVFHLHKVGALEQFKAASSSHDVADRLGYDRSAFQAIVDYVSRTTDLLIFEPPEHYRLNDLANSYGRFGFPLDKFIGAYGPLLENLEGILRDPKSGEALINHGKLATAFHRAENSGAGQMPGLLREWHVHNLVDLGCGTGALLRELCRGDSEFRGWGIERDACMCEIAIKEIASQGLAERVRILRGDVRGLNALLTNSERDAVGALHGRSILNEFFRDGLAEVIEFLRILGKSFPGRLFFAVDYYSVLSRPGGSHESYDALLQDIAQFLSGQGVPPPDLEGWIPIYEEAGCKPIHVYHGSVPGLNWFVHVLQLGS